jgi:hypothetical protein
MKFPFKFTPPRMADWWIASITLTLVIGAIAPQQLGVTLYKLNLIFLAGVTGYWLDRSMFPYARPDALISGSTPNCCWSPEDVVAMANSAMLRRAIIVAGSMIAAALGA